MKYCLIVNPHSRGGRAKVLAERCVRDLARQGCSFDTEVVRDFQQAYTLSQKANSRGYDVIVAIGGDGTLNRVMNGFYDLSGKRVSEARFGVLHTGTSPDFCRSYGVPLDLREAVQSLVDRKTRTIPVGRIRCAHEFQRDHEGKTIDEVRDANVAYFACCANVGLGAALARKANAGIRKYLGDAPGTFLSLLQILSRYRPGRYDAVYDAERVRLEDVLNVSIGLTQHIASGIKSYKGNMDTRNRFYIITVRRITLRNVGPMLCRVYSGKEYENTEYLSMTEAGTIDILGSGMSTEIEYDGDPGGYLPCSVDIAPDRLELIV